MSAPSRPLSPALPSAARSRWVEPTALTGLLLFHGFLSLQLFGPERPWQRLVDDEPIVSGRHPLHLYHATLAAVESCDGCCFDTTFYAGYPKTPVFDSDCRPVEWVLRLVGHQHTAVAYKIGLTVCWWLLPLGHWLAARVARLGPGTGSFAVALSILLAWSPLARDRLEQGDIVPSLVAVTAALQLAFFARCHDQPTLTSWLGLFITASAGWSLQPLLWSSTTLFVLVCWLWVGRRHGFIWHLGFLACHAGALLLNYPTLDEWLRYWWIRLPQHGILSDPAGPGTTTGAVSWERLTFLFILVTGVGGAVRRWLNTQRCPTLWPALAAGLAFALAAVSSTRDAFLPVGTLTLAALGLWLSAVPAAHSLSRAAAWLMTASGRRHVGVVIGGGLFLLVGGVVARRPAAGELPAWGPRPLALGMPPEAAVLVRVLDEATTPAARILWEDLPGRRDCGWSVLVSSRLGRSCIGGLDPEGILEHSTIGLRNGWLAGRPLAAWTDAELGEYGHRYNVGWIVCSSPDAQQRFSRWPLAVGVPIPPAPEGWHVFALRRPFSFVLKGTAQNYDADPRRVTLSDVVPEDGEVVLSLHYQTGWSVRPAWIRVEREVDAYDPIPFIRLRLPGPVGRVTLTWERP